MKKKQPSAGSMFEESTTTNETVTPIESIDEAPFETTDAAPNTPESEGIPTSFNQLISRELVKFDVVVPKVNELAKEYLPLKIASVDDEDGYNNVSKALRFIVSKRTAVEDKRKELKADSLAYGRAVDARAKEITAMLEPIESHLKNEKQRIDDEKKRIEEEEEERKQAIINTRINTLMGLGMYQTVTEFVWKSKLNPEEEETFLRINLELWSDEDFTYWVNELTARNESEQKIIDDREAKQKEEAELARQEADRIAKAKEELEKEKARMLEDMNNLKRERATLRNAKLAELGLSTISFNPYWCYINRSGKILTKIASVVHHDDVLHLDSAAWDELFEKIKIDVAKLKEEDDAALKIEEEERKNQQEKEEEEERANKRRESRNKTLVSLGLTNYDDYWMFNSKLGNKPLASTEDVSNLDVEQWAQKVEDITKTVAELKLKDQQEADRLAKEEKEQAEKIAKEKEEQEEKERKANMSDKELYLEYINILKAVPTPQLKTKKWDGYLQTIVKTIDTFKNMN